MNRTIWGQPAADDHSPLWTAKFCGKIEHPDVWGTVNGKQVKLSKAWTEYLITPGFSTEKFIEQRNAGLKKTGTRNAFTKRDSYR